MLRFFKNEKLKCSTTRGCLTLFLISLVIGNFICLKLFIDSMKKEENLKLVKNEEGFLDKLSNDLASFNTMEDSITKAYREKQAFELPNKVKLDHIKEEVKEAEEVRQPEETKNNEEGEEDGDKEDEIENDEFNPRQNDHRHRHHQRKRLNPI